MKTKVLLPALLSLLLGMFVTPRLVAAAINYDDTLTLYTAPGLIPLAGMWTDAYAVAQPGSVIRLKPFDAGAFPGIEGESPGLVLLSSETWASLDKKAGWKMAVGRDVVVPVMNAENPFAGKIMEQGISAGQLSLLFEEYGVEPDWGNLLEEGKRAPVHYYYVSGASFLPAVAAFLNLEPASLTGTGVATEEALVRAVANDPYAFGFCRIINVPDPEEGGGVVLLPVDRNGNGTLDYHEQIYGNLNDFMRGVWIGKYPRALVQSLYLAAPDKPGAGAAADFLKWVVTDGQNYLGTAGFSELVYSERQSKLEALATDPLFPEVKTGNYATIRIILLVILGAGVAGLIVNVLFRRHRRNDKPGKYSRAHPEVIREQSLEIPGGVYYDKTHTWAFMDKCGYVKVGVDDFLQHVTGPYTRVQLKQPGEKVKKGEPFFSLVQDGKQLVVHAPVSGIIKAVNEDLDEEPVLINLSPFDEGWVYLLEPTNWQRELQFLRMAEAYRDWLRNEFARLKDFLAAHVNAKSFAYADVVLQEGGEVTDHVMEKLGPEVWEEFQKNFLHTAY